jgi:hypothetical protein
MRKSTKLLVAVAAAGTIAGAGSAFTASNTLSGDNVAGYGSSTVSGATIEAMEHTLSSDGTTITSTSLTFTTDLGASHQVKAGFGTAALQSCTVTVNLSPTEDTAVCTYSTAPTTSTATDFHVAVS